MERLRNHWVRPGRQLSLYLGLGLMGLASAGCPECSNNSDCDDGMYCNGEEYCSTSEIDENVMVCYSRSGPCEEGQTCNEAEDTCE